MSQSAATAFAARCALRVLPLFTPADAERQRIELRAASICCFIAVHSAIDRARPYAHLGEQAARALRGAPENIPLSAEQCVVAAARTAAARDITEASGNALLAAQGYYGLASALGLEPPLAAAAEADLDGLEGVQRAKDPWLSSEYFFVHRPLWPERMPDAIKTRIDEWAATFERFGLGAIRNLYLSICFGKPSSAKSQTTHVIEAWIADEGLPRPEAAGDPVGAPGGDWAPAPPPTAPPPRAAGAPDVWMLADRPLDERFAAQDKFQFRDYADALAAILDHEKTDTPFTMAINAPWGAGKTTLANMIAEQLRQRPADRGEAPHIICHFNAWMHDDAPNLATAFISEVSRTANRHRAPILRLLHPLPWALLEPTVRRWRRVWVGAVVLLLALAAAVWLGEHLQHVKQRAEYESSKMRTYQTTGTVVLDAAGRRSGTQWSTTATDSRPVEPPPAEPRAPDRLDGLLHWTESRVVVLGGFFTALAGLMGFLVKLLTSTALGGFVQSPEKAAESGAIETAQRQLRTLIRQATWRGNRFVVFVDDIERCKPPRSIDVLDAVNLLMDHKDVLVVLLGDMSAVAAAAQLKYKELAEIYVPSAGIALTGPDRGKESFGRLYLQKIIQFQFDLPIPPKNRIRSYMGQLAITPRTEGEARGRATA